MAASRVAGLRSNELVGVIPGVDRDTTLSPRRILQRQKMLMNATDIGRELLYPLTDMAIVFAMIFYWFLFGLAQNAGLFGIALLFLTLPAYYRY